MTVKETFDAMVDEFVHGHEAPAVESNGVAAAVANVA